MVPIMWNRHSALGCVVGLCVVLLAGCGSSPAKTASTAGGGSTPSPSSPDTSRPESSASLSRLKEIVLQAADLPAGTKGTARKPDPNTAASQAEMAKCAGVRNTDRDKIAEAHSENYALANTTISSSATSYRSQSDLDTRLALLRSTKAPSCFNELLRKQLTTVLPAGTSIESVSVKITPGPAGGPANVVATAAGAILVYVSGQKVPVYASLAFITGPLIEARVEVVNIGAPPSASAMTSLVVAVATRAAKG